MTSATDAARVLGVAYLTTPQTVARYGAQWVLDCASLIDALDRRGLVPEPEVAGRLLGGRRDGQLGELADYCGADRVSDHRCVLWRLVGVGEPRWSRFPPGDCVGCGVETLMRFLGVAVHPHCLGWSPRVPAHHPAGPRNAPFPTHKELP